MKIENDFKKYHPVKEGDEITVVIERQGNNKEDGIVKIGSFYIIVKNGIKNTLCKIKITKCKDTYAFAEIIEIIKKD